MERRAIIARHASRYLAASFSLALVLITSGWAEEAIKLEATIDKDRAALGEPIKLNVTAGHEEPVQWEPRSVADRLGSFDVKQVSGPETIRREGGGAQEHGGLLTRWTFHLASFELGKAEIPEIQIRYTTAGSPDARTISTPVFKVEIVPTVSDPNARPADIRSGFTIPADLRRWLLWIGAATVILLAGIFGWRALRRRLRKEVPPEPPDAPAPPPRPAYERYLEALEALLRKGLIEAGRYKEFHVEISEIVKRYLGEIYAFDAVDRTTWEVMADMSERATPDAVRAETGAFLQNCDLVKFAKYVPDRSECLDTAARARRILDLARPAARAPGSEAPRAVAAEAAAP